MLYLAIALGLIFIGIGILTTIKNYHKSKLNIPTKKYIQTKWREIENLPEDRIKEAIFEADKLLDYTLTKMGARDRNITPKIEKMSHCFGDPELVLKAHKFRNRLAHDIHFSPTKKTLASKLLAFKQAFIDLDIFDI